MANSSIPREIPAKIHAPAPADGGGIIPRPGQRIMLRKGDRFAARWRASTDVELCCEVLEKRGKSYHCRILNGMWGLKFNEQGVARHQELTAEIVMLLPTKLSAVDDMDNWDQVLKVVERQLRRAIRAASES